MQESNKDFTERMANDLRVKADARKIPVLTFRQLTQIKRAISGLKSAEFHLGTIYFTKNVIELIRIRNVIREELINLLAIHDASSTSKAEHLIGLKEKLAKLVAKIKGSKEK